MREWALSNWAIVLTVVGSALTATVRWGRTIFRLLAAPFIVGILREQNAELKIQVGELTTLVARYRSEIASVASSPASPSAGEPSIPPSTPPPLPKTTKPPATP